MTKSRRTNVTDPAAPGVDYQDAQIQYTCQSSVTNRPIEWIISGLMEAGLSGGRSPPVSWCSRVVLTVNSDAGDEGSDHLRVEQVGESDRLVAVGAGPAEVDPAGEHSAVRTVDPATLAIRDRTRAHGVLTGEIDIGRTRHQSETRTGSGRCVIYPD
jgi:hypothetical protein